MRTKDAKERKKYGKICQGVLWGYTSFCFLIFLDIERVYWKNRRLILIDLERKLKKIDNAGLKPTRPFSLLWKCPSFVTEQATANLVRIRALYFQPFGIAMELSVTA